VEGRTVIEVELLGAFRDSTGKSYAPGKHQFTSEIAIAPADPAAAAFAVPEVTIGIGFHWERQERQVFRGPLRVLKREAGLTLINDVSLEEYVTSVISSEMSASCPIELLKAHAVISRSWLAFPSSQRRGGAERRGGQFGGSVFAGLTPSIDGGALPGLRGLRPPSAPPSPSSPEIRRWYGREAHPDFDVCADDHCQRYQGITKAFSPAASQAVRATTGEFLRYNGEICDARFSKCCGGITEEYPTAWEDTPIPYLRSFYDGPAPEPAPPPASPEQWILSSPPAYCNTRDAELLSRILPGFDQETVDFYRWRVEYSPEELAEIIKSKIDGDLGPIRNIQSLARGPSSRIYRLRIMGESDSVIIGKELEIRRALSRSHLYSSAFVVEKDSGRIVLRGAGWGHGVGLCQIGAAVMADGGKGYREILQHYYPGTAVSV
jgi:SpoIID/LytB domain protein